MVAITGVAMVGLPAQTVVNIMSNNDKDNSGDQKPYMVVVKNFLEQQKGKPDTKKKYR
ncbi:MAG TPA: hypothetical protein VFV68_05540 [Agriterribacter sp.]|nr:hypothetical protein [Agriterribacter sp.]